MIQLCAVIQTLLEYTNLFSPNDLKNNDQIIKRIFKK